jgi:hypothetical protein
MRFMMLMIPQDYADAMPPDDEVDAMARYNQTLKEAGVLLALDGLTPPSAGVRVAFSSGRPVVTDGPFAEAKEALGGYWVIDVRSRAEAIEWASRCPASDGDVIEVREVQEGAVFPAEEP